MAHTPKRKLAASPTPKLHGLRQPIALTLPPELVTRLDEIAAAEERSRVKVIEFACREYVQRREQAGADHLAKPLAPPTARERAVRGAGRRA